jgi:histidinol-phosphate/aromatic aminotransferase/cobyric acid decarboxylase-like protein
LGSAGVRVGVIISNNSNIESLSQFRDMYEISGLSLRWTQVVIKNKESVANYINQIKSTKKELIDLLVKTGYEVFDGECNWVHIRKDGPIKLPDNMIFRSDCEIPGNYNLDWIRLQVSTNIDNYKFLFDI